MAVEVRTHFSPFLWWWLTCVPFTNTTQQLCPMVDSNMYSLQCVRHLYRLISDDGTFYHGPGNWRALHHHAACWLVNMTLCPPVAIVKRWICALGNWLPTLAGNKHDEVLYMNMWMGGASSSARKLEDGWQAYTQLCSTAWKLAAPIRLQYSKIKASEYALAAAACGCAYVTATSHVLESKIFITIT